MELSLTGFLHEQVNRPLVLIAHSLGGLVIKRVRIYQTPLFVFFDASSL